MAKVKNWEKEARELDARLISGMMPPKVYNRAISKLISEEYSYND